MYCLEAALWHFFTHKSVKLSTDYAGLLKTGKLIITVYDTFLAMKCFSHQFNKVTWFTGGAPNLPPGLPPAYYLNYNGCLQRLEVDKVPVNLLHLNTSLPVDQCKAR